MRCLFGIAIVVSLLAAALAGADTGVGASLGITVLSPSEGGEQVTSIAAPGSTNFFVPGAVPGLRLAWLDPDGRVEFALEGTFSSFITEGFSATSTALTGNLQLNLSPDSQSSPYVTGGGGLFYAGSDSDSSVNPTLGLGLGVRNRVAEGHGTVRFEIHYDHVFEDSSGFIGGNAFSGKIGFDLWSRGQ